MIEEKNFTLIQVNSSVEMSLSWYQKYKEKGECYIETIYYKEKVG